MRGRLKAIQSIFALIMVVFVCSACQKSLSQQELTIQQKNVLAAAKQFKHTYNNHNKSKLKKLIADDAVLMTGKDKTMMTKTEYLSKYPERWNDYPKYANNFTDVTLKSNEQAVVKSYFIVGNNRFTMNWIFEQNQEGQWLLAAFDY